MIFVSLKYLTDSLTFSPKCLGNLNACNFLFQVRGLRLRGRESDSEGRRLSQGEQQQEEKRGEKVSNTFARWSSFLISRPILP